MSDATVHFRGRATEQQTFTAFPRRGDLIDAGGLWQVDALVFGERIEVYATRLADTLEASTRQPWQTWGDTAAVAEPAKAQNRLFA